MIAMIVAADKNNLIGTAKTKNGIPWHNAEDFRHFREMTIGQTILMGRKTYEAIGRPLPKRHTIVLSRKKLALPPEVEQAFSLTEVLSAFRDSPKTLYICGGASVYEAFLPYTDILYLSRIPGEYEGEVYFPDFDMPLEQIIQKETFTLEIYRR